MIHNRMLHSGHSPACTTSSPGEKSTCHAVCSSRVIMVQGKYIVRRDGTGQGWLILRRCRKGGGPPKNDLHQCMSPPTSHETNRGVFVSGAHLVLLVFNYWCFLWDKLMAYLSMGYVEQQAHTGCQGTTTPHHTTRERRERAIMQSWRPNSRTCANKWQQTCPIFATWMARQWVPRETSCKGTWLASILLRKPNDRMEPALVLKARQIGRIMSCPVKFPWFGANHSSPFTREKIFTNEIPGTVNMGESDDRWRIMT